jgi:hypothetical protein
VKTVSSEALPKSRTSLSTANPRRTSVSAVTLIPEQGVAASVAQLEVNRNSPGVVPREERPSVSVKDLTLLFAGGKRQKFDESPVRRLSELRKKTLTLSDASSGSRLSIDRRDLVEAAVQTEDAPYDSEEWRKVTEAPAKRLRVETSLGFTVRSKMFNDEDD